MQGTRRDAEPGDGNQYPYPHLQPGEYGKDAAGEWWCVPPSGVPHGYVGRLSKHKINVHDDGTITVWPSILIQCGSGETLWHGFLERGVWRAC